ncbi:MAG TPA: folate-binding protein [Solirubrobacteraceae bacterium]|nr:folate-binding protein [Solirubrobacteraceae bacterium]
MASTDTTALAAEYETLTERCGLVDRSERGKLALTGEDAVEFLNGQVTNELLDLVPGQGRYAAFLTHKGKMLGDLRILAAGEPGAAPDELLLDTERMALQALFDMIRRFKVGYRVELHKRTLESSLLSLVGPGAEEVLRAARDDGGTTRSGQTSAAGQTSAELPDREHDHMPDTIAGTIVRLIRTDLGVDVLLDSAGIEVVREALENAGAVPVSESAAEILRVESGRPRYGIDMDASTIPQEAGLNERAVSFTKGCYVGQETVARLHYKGKPNRHLRGLRLLWPTPPGAELHLGERAVGHLGSAVLSPKNGPIGLALVRREAAPGATVQLGADGASAVVVELPFG